MITKLWIELISNIITLLINIFSIYYFFNVWYNLYYKDIQPTNYQVMFMILLAIYSIPKNNK